MNNPRSKLLIDDILRDGFGTISDVFSNDKSDLLSAKCEEMLVTDYEFSGVSKQSPESGKIYNNAQTEHTAYKTAIRKLIGVSQTVDNLVEEILTNEIVNNTLVSFLGKDYKIYSCAIRHASHLSSYVGLHQDAYYEFSMAYFLNDIDPKSPTTVFCKKTHKIPFKFTDKFEALDTKYFKNKLSPAIGKKGDILFFLNKTLHGMQTSLKKIDHSSVILFCFHPSGYPYSPWRLPDKSRYSSSFISGLGPELQRLFKYNPDDYMNLNGEVIIKNSSKDTTRLIDSIVINQEYSGNYMSTLYWFIIYYISLIFRAFRKVIRFSKRLFNHFFKV